MTTDPFLRHVPERLHHLKTGHRILIFSVFNVASQPSQLLRLINERTIHAARLVIAQDDYLDYDRDVVLSPCENFGHESVEIERDKLEELADLAKCATFYHICQRPMNLPGTNWMDHLRPDNSLVQYFGTDIRAAWPDAFKWHRATGIMGLSAWDFTMLNRLLTFYHVPLMFNADAILTTDHFRGGPLRVCHAPTDRKVKQTDLFLKAMDELRAEGLDVEPVMIENVSNVECLKIKATCQITYDQMGIGIYGLSAIESMAMEHAVLCGMSNFAQSYYPNCPVVSVTPDTLKSAIRALAVGDYGSLDPRIVIRGRDTLRYIGRRSYSWARLHHDPWSVFKRYLHLYDFITHGHRVVTDLDLDNQLLSTKELQP